MKGTSRFSHSNPLSPYGFPRSTLEVARSILHIQCCNSDLAIFCIPTLAAADPTRGTNSLALSSDISVVSSAKDISVRSWAKSTSVMILDPTLLLFLRSRVSGLPRTVVNDYCKEVTGKVLRCHPVTHLLEQFCFFVWRKGFVFSYMSRISSTILTGMP